MCQQLAAGVTQQIQELVAEREALLPERAAFEQWTASEGGNLTRHSDDQNRYASATVQGRWRAYKACWDCLQACVAAERERCIAVVRSTPNGCALADNRAYVEQFRSALLAELAGAPKT